MSHAQQQREPHITPPPRKQYLRLAINLSPELAEARDPPRGLAAEEARGYGAVGARVGLAPRFAPHAMKVKVSGTCSTSGTVFDSV